jgi:hypothetical protein
VFEAGIVPQAEAGTPRGSPISPLLANIALQCPITRGASFLAGYQSVACETASVNAPAKYLPRHRLRQMANGGPWTGDRIVVAIRAWAEQTGATERGTVAGAGTSGASGRGAGHQSLRFLVRGNRGCGVRATPPGQPTRWPPHFDEVAQTIAGGDVETTAVEGSTEEQQFG